MKILFPIAIFYPTTIGGPSSSVYWLSKYLKKNGINCYIVTTNFKVPNNYNTNTWINLDCGFVYYTKSKNPKFPIYAVYITYKTIPKCDIVHYSSAYSLLTLFTIIYSILLKKTVILSPRGEFFEEAIDKFVKKIIIKFYILIKNKIVFHATSNEEVNAITKLFKNPNIFTQPNFINELPREKKQVFSKDFVYLGIIYDIKKIENTIIALYKSKYFVNSISNFIIAGKPLRKIDYLYLNYLHDLTKKYNLENKIKFIGEIYNQNKYNLLYNAYFLILSSDRENFGNVIIEALSQSTPVIVSKGAPWEILNIYKAGWWVNNDPDKLSEIIDKALLLDENSYLEMCSNALYLYNKFYNINTSENNIWLKIYNSFKK
ncbi:hypothetical protein JCM31826_08100 [Thermaurantimonas aggregans]|uniref:Glycosyl transferase family 1 domain-containing protein n=1 Tax=Thermaurantimonas aggregans TaxID=2173829 RepID=A0A401XJZ1_9FLAO|nr:glycosyltransferase [Thermaurantimonas aggregans]GCD77328.1 hypothetical protein JCM31826_08100 [Thermaurantimonas aggregans]